MPFDVSVNGLKHSWQTVGTDRVKLTESKFKTYKGVLVKCPGVADDTPNTDPIYVGGASVTADYTDTGGVPIIPGESIFIPMSDPSLLYLISNSEDQKVAWMII